MTSFEVKLSVVPGWKCRGHIIADCFVLSENADTTEDIAASLRAASCLDECLMFKDVFETVRGCVDAGDRFLSLGLV